MLQISEKLKHKKRRFWNNYQHFMKRGYSQMFIKKRHPRGMPISRMFGKLSA